eukprot:2973402-Rhodomonas_salina.1
MHNSTASVQFVPGTRVLAIDFGGFSCLISAFSCNRSRYLRHAPLLVAPQPSQYRRLVAA